MTSRCLLGVVSTGLLWAVAAGLKTAAAEPSAASVMAERNVFIVLFSCKVWLAIQPDNLTGTMRRNRHASAMFPVDPDSSRCSIDASVACAPQHIPKTPPRLGGDPNSVL